MKHLNIILILIVSFNHLFAQNDDRDSIQIRELVSDVKDYYFGKNKPFVILTICENGKFVGLSSSLNCLAIDSSHVMDKENIDLALIFLGEHLGEYKFVLIQLVNTLDCLSDKNRKISLRNEQIRRIVEFDILLEPGIVTFESDTEF